MEFENHDDVDTGINLFPGQFACHAQSLAKHKFSLAKHNKNFLAKPILSCQANSLLLSKFSLVKPILLPSGYAGMRVFDI